MPGLNSGAKELKLNQWLDGAEAVREWYENELKDDYGMLL